MASDWIKMRGSLLENPKLIRMCGFLQESQGFREWLTPGGGGQMNGQICSYAALRCVIAGSLLKVWSGAREHGKFVGDDLVLEHSELSDLDQMAGIPGIGEAMKEVGWALPKSGVTLPNFREFNVAVSDAERQKTYRKRVAENVLHGVTKPLRDSNEMSRTRVEKSTTTSTTTAKDGVIHPKGKRFSLGNAPPEWIEFCLLTRPDLDAELTFTRFKNYWQAKSGRDAAKLDWFATWQNWCTSERVQPGQKTVASGLPAGHIKCRTCGAIAGSYTDGQCDPCWRAR